MRGPFSESSVHSEDLTEEEAFCVLHCDYKLKIRLNLLCPWKVLSFYQKVVSCKSQKGNEHSAAGFQFLMCIWNFLFNKHQEQGGNHLMLAENEMWVVISSSTKETNTSFMWKR